MFAVEICDESLTFNAMHFVAFASRERPNVRVAEPLHGHDFKASARIEGELDKDECVLDFVAAKEALARALAIFDHRVLLARFATETQYCERDGEVEILFDARARWVAPAASVLWLDAAVATTERVAERALDEWRKELRRVGLVGADERRLRAILRLQESPGVFAVVDGEL